MKIKPFFRFVIVGACGFFVDVGVLYIVLFLGMDYLYGRIISFLIAVLFTWQLNRNFTFNSSPPQPRLLKEAWRYFLAASLGGLVNIAVYGLVVFTFNRTFITPFIGVALGSCAGLGINYLAAKNFVFNSKIS